MCAPRTDVLQTRKEKMAVLRDSVWMLFLLFESFCYELHRGHRSCWSSSRRIKGHTALEFLRDSLKSLQRLQCGSEISELDQKELVDIIYSVLSMVTFEVEHQADELQHLFRELLDVCCAEGSPLKEEKLLSCMLRKRSRGLLNLYSSVLVDKTREKFLVSKSVGKGLFFFFLCCGFLFNNFVWALNRQGIMQCSC